MSLEERIRNSTQVATLALRTDAVHRFADLVPVTATPGLGIVGAMATAAVAGSEIGKNAD